MKAKLDENLPLRIATRLRSLDTMFTRPNKKTSRVVTIPSFGHRFSEKAALSSRRIWISRTAVTPGTHYGIVLVRLHSPSRLRLVERLEEVFQGEAVSEWTGCFVVVTDQKIRVRRMPNQQ